MMLQEFEIYSTIPKSYSENIKHIYIITNLFIKFVYYVTSNDTEVNLCFL